MKTFANFHCSGKTDIGRKRSNNEDAFGMFPEAGVFVVADGMGGGDDGEVASAETVKAVGEFTAAYPQLETGGYVADSYVDGINVRLNKASAIIKQRTVDNRLNICGSTVVGFAIDPVNPGQALAFHAGDSRLYRCRNGELKQITCDHSAAQLIGADDEEKINPMFRGMILRGVGLKNIVNIEKTPFDIAQGDRLLLCSDGLYRMVNDKTLQTELASGKAEELAARLVAIGNENGGEDNLTAVVVEIGEISAPCATATLPEAVVALPQAEAAAQDEENASRGSSGSPNATVTSTSDLSSMANEFVFEADETSAEPAGSVPEPMPAANAQPAVAATPRMPPSEKPAVAGVPAAKASTESANSAPDNSMTLNIVIAVVLLILAICYFIFF